MYSLALDCIISRNEIENRKLYPFWTNKVSYLNLRQLTSWYALCWGPALHFCYTQLVIHGIRPGTESCLCVGQY
jgi:hypothetical protein